MELNELSATDLDTLKSQGYDDTDLEMLDKSEVDALLGRNRLGEGDEEDPPAAASNKPAVDPHEAAAAAQDAALREADEAGNVTSPPAAAPAPAPAAGPTHVSSFRTSFDADAVAADKAKITELEGSEAAAFKRLMDGEIDAEEYQKIKGEVAANVAELKERVLEARVLSRVSERNAEADAQAQWQAAQNELLPQFKAAGLDYARPGPLAAFNAHLKALAADQKNGNRDARWFLSEADRLVREDLGLKPLQKSAGKASSGVDMSEIPPTLRGVPAAGGNAIQADEFAELDRLAEGNDPIAYERAMAALTDKQRDRYLGLA